MTKQLFFVFCLMAPLIMIAQTDSIPSGIYNWQQPISQNTIKTAILFEGSMYDMEWLQMSANSISATKKKIKITVPQNEEYLLIIKSGLLSVTIKDSARVIRKGSMALLLPGEKFSIQNINNEPCDYYQMKYRSRMPVNLKKGKNAGGSFVKEWNSIPFISHDKGGIRKFYEQPTAMTKRMEMHVTTLNVGLKSHDPHTHRAEEIVLVIEGNTEMQIGQKFYQGSAGAIFYLGSNVLHAIRNTGTEPCTYFAFQFE